MARSLRDETAISSVGTILGLSACDEDDLYQAMDYLYSRQKEIERSLADKHLEDGILVLYDISSAAPSGMFSLRVDWLSQRRGEGKTADHLWPTLL